MPSLSSLSDIVVILSLSLKSITASAFAALSDEQNISLKHAMHRLHWRTFLRQSRHLATKILIHERVEHARIDSCGNDSIKIVAQVM